MAYPYKNIIAIVQIPAQNYTWRQCITAILLYAVLCWCKTSPNCDFPLHNDIQEWYALWKQKKPFVRSENSNFYCLQPYSDIISTHLFCGRTSKQPLDVRSYTFSPYVHKAMVVRPTKTPLENCCLCSFSAHFMLSENRIFVRKGGVGCFYRILGDIKKDRKKGKMPILHHCVSWQRRNFATCRKLWQQYLWQKFSMLSWKSHGYNTVGIYRTHLNSVMSPKECKKTRV